MWREEQSPRVKEGKKAHVERKVRGVFSGSLMDNVRKEIHAVSVMTN